ncbi:MAG TPA: hypothetical protein VGS08_02800 [Candidatus Saccharimonadales bacterium]|nr:hypothetical protein [Candidatus Saccharimonadales bacterium]
MSESPLWKHYDEQREAEAQRLLAEQAERARQVKEKAEADAAEWESQVQEAKRALRRELEKDEMPRNIADAVRADAVATAQYIKEHGGKTEISIEAGPCMPEPPPGTARAWTRRRYEKEKILAQQQRQVIAQGWHIYGANHLIAVEREVGPPEWYQGGNFTDDPNLMSYSPYATFYDSNYRGLILDDTGQLMVYNYFPSGNPSRQAGPLPVDELPPKLFLRPSVKREPAYYSEQPDYQDLVCPDIIPVTLDQLAPQQSVRPGTALEEQPLVTWWRDQLTDCVMRTCPPPR